MLKVKVFEGGYVVDYKSKEFKIFVDEINKPVIALLDEVITTLRSVGVGGNSNAGDLANQIKKVEKSLNDYKLEQYNAEIKREVEMNYKNRALLFKVIAITALILAVFNIILLITTQ